MLYLYELVTWNSEGEMRLFLPVFQTWHAIPCISFHFQMHTLSLESITKNTSLLWYLTLDLENKSYLFRVHDIGGSGQQHSDKDIWSTYMKIYEGKKK